MRRGLTTVVAAVAIMAGVAGCTSGGSGGSDGSDGSEGAAQHLSAAKACDDGTYTWFNVSQRSVLTDMKPGRHVEKGEKVSTKEVGEVARYTRSVRTDGADLSSKAVIRALAEHLKLSDRLVGDGSGPDEPTTKYDSSVASGERKAEASGRYVPAREVDLVEADFHYSCEDSSFQDAAVSGHVVTWQTPMLFVVACGEKPEKNRSQGEREAARLGCREGDPARA